MSDIQIYSDIQIIKDMFCKFWDRSAIAFSLNCVPLWCFNHSILQWNENLTKWSFFKRQNWARLPKIAKIAIDPAGVWNCSLFDFSRIKHLWNSTLFDIKNLGVGKIWLKNQILHFIRPLVEIALHLIYQTFRSRH